MKSHFSLLNQIGFSQNFVFSSPPKNLLSMWKEVHKRKKKRKSILYLGLLKKQKRKAFKISKFKNTKFHSCAFALETKKTDITTFAHAKLFKKRLSKQLPLFNFYHTKNLEVSKSIRHNGYNAHGEILWYHSKKYTTSKF
jgi:hypothetical protein